MAVQCFSNFHQWVPDVLGMEVAQPMTFIGPQEFSLADGPVDKQHREPHLALMTFDPGGTTGWSLIVLPKIVTGDHATPPQFTTGTEVFKCPIDIVLKSARLWLHGQVDCHDVNEGAFILRKNLIDQWPTAALVFESFFLRGGQRNIDLTPVELNAILGHHLWIKHRTRHFQQPSMAKRMTDARLKQLNVHVREGGLEHARDADRHVLMMIRRCMENKGWKERLWPHVYENH